MLACFVDLDPGFLKDVDRGGLTVLRHGMDTIDIEYKGNHAVAEDRRHG